SVEEIRDRRQDVRILPPGHGRALAGGPRRHPEGARRTRDLPIARREGRRPDLRRASRLGDIAKYSPPFCGGGYFRGTFSAPPSPESPCPSASYPRRSSIASPPARWS